jgi:hypothetical protein
VLGWITLSRKNITMNVFFNLRVSTKKPTGYNFKDVVTDRQCCPNLNHR